MSRNDDKSRAAVDRIKTAALSAAKGLNRSQAKHAATSAARNVPMGRRKRDQAAGRRGRRLILAAILVLLEIHEAPLQFEAGRAQANFAVHRQLFVATARSSVGGIDDGMHGQMSCAAHMTASRSGFRAGRLILLADDGSGQDEERTSELEESTSSAWILCPWLLPSPWIDD
uniref:Uncharacterized protein n=1 Tax=Oryza sativa subsp. japonica TaxID=39947 RepID=Q8GRX0_ORYSJ|nr:hypothetical protein [Oryza sativa Japonica Group]BAD31266.1 hypothetical protein [Oryza sativa Japonica Group]